MSQPVDKSLAVSGVIADGYAFSAPWRVLAAALIVFIASSLLLIFLLVLVSTDPPITPDLLYRIVGFLVLPPAVLVWWIHRASEAAIEVDHLSLAIDRSGLRLEVPCNAIDAVVPWVVPLPGPGFSLRMRSGRRLRYGLATMDVARLLQALAQVADVAVAERALSHPTVIYAAARSATGRWSWMKAVLKFGVFALFPAGILFNAHQHIAYGGPLGEYYMLGLRSYVTTFVVYFTTTVIYLVLYANLWRLLAEAGSLLAAWVAPAWAMAVRKAAELGCGVVYYGGVPLLLLLRFLA